MSTDLETELPQGLGGRLILSAKDYQRGHREAWLLERRKGLGASEISAVMGLNDFNTPLDIWLEKTSTAEPTDKNMPEAALWGHRNEHNVAIEFAIRNPKLGKIAPTPGLLAHPEYDEIRATLDRVLVKRRVRPVQAVAAVECKTVGDFAYKNYWADGLPPIHIQLQAQWQMAVTGLPTVYVPHLVGGNYMPEPIVFHRDEDVIEQIVEFGRAWWHDHIVLGERPAVTVADSAKFTDLWPGEAGKRLVAGATLASLVGEHLDFKRQEAAAKKAKDEVAKQIQLQMTNAELIVDGAGKQMASWRLPAVSRSIPKAMMERLEEDHPEIAKEYIVESQGARKFLTKEIA